MRSPLCFFHKISLFLGSVGIFISNTMLAYAVITLVSLNTVAALMPPDFQYLLYLNTQVLISLLNLGFVYIFALVVQKMGEQGIIGGLRSCATVLVTGELPPVAPCISRVSHAYLMCPMDCPHVVAAA